MESWHVVGQKVTPKDDLPWLTPMKWWRILWYSTSRNNPVFGKVYTIASIGLVDCVRYRGTVFLLKEMPGIWNSANGFRPVRPTSIECFRCLLSPTPEQVRELEDA